MSDESSILLRTTANSPMTTKGSQLTWEEFDANMILMFNLFVENRLSSYVSAYDSGTTYDDSVVNYAVYSGAIWKWISATPGSAVTPGTDASKWVKKFAADLAHKKNSDTILAEGTADEVSAADLAAFVNNTPVTFRMSKVIASADVLALNSSPATIITHPGGDYAGKKIVITSCQITNLIETSPASTPYATYLTAQLRTQTATIPQFMFTSVLNATSSRSVMGAPYTSAFGATDKQLKADADIELYVSGGDPTAGDYDIQVDIQYIIID